MERDLTTGSVIKNIAYFSLPYLLSYFLQTLYGMADLFIVGQFNGVDRITAVSETIAYLTICFMGIPFITAYNIISSIFRGLGDSRSPMYFIAVACMANIVLDYIFIGGMNLGAAKAALGTTLSQAVSVVISLSKAVMMLLTFI